jgi:hypothetical protein
MKKYTEDNATKAFKAAAKMPPLYHQMPNQEFDYAKSEVIDWLCEQSEIRRAMFDYYRSALCIVFDKETGTWKGRDS